MSSADLTTTECTVFFLPGLGLDAGAATPIADAADPRLRVVGVDLLSAGRAASVDDLADIALEQIIAQADGGPFLVCGHSLGGKVAGRVMARILSGTETVFGLAGAVLLAPSPPSPEPIPDEKRATMLEAAAGEHLSDEDAATFLDDNLGVTLDPALREQAMTAIRRQPASAWRDWLTSGSLEDATRLVGVLDLPVVVMSSDNDENLGAHVQPELLADVYPRAVFERLPDVGHLLPYEAPERVAAQLALLWDHVRSSAPQVPSAWGHVLASTRVDPQVRRVLAQRALADDTQRAPRALTSGQLDTLRHLAARLVPQGDGPAIDLALRVDTMLADGGTDGWRPAGLPADPIAYGLALDAVAAQWPSDVDAQNRLIVQLMTDGIHADGMAATGIRSWFEDARNDLLRAWLAHPASLARIGYDGFAVGGTEAEPAGWTSIAAGTREEWEPAELGRVEATR
ncbi:alpha/beta hydrolase [Microbacterium sp. EYE_5]|uniref:alpha/beta fold hydrolase n=1 Tax=unclassified Microbacterium TaxID=2609290 RepID=UPI002003780F|nr:MULTISPECIES: alpha/beta hydrolase [unclassified Microbacterium]MCK6079027.1 alpha/beta hydrolase [Microbacterium sp. EYE_382]MCK6084297.1 alpha/beta hydrolase [Microbacterium sp. EYE_384]MCK6123474.1 alpha/beta hydrolase [Microbacterium sp. EYE_80]MCK6125061.1 alpha/beta hydrolase [Microbacterium sp. EYE_79]MCK6142891.1 alpha/beta hydrolase [Microbacterium sp. EYE_39]